MNQALGDRLKEARKTLGMSAEELSTITKINQEFIQALEDGRWDLRPGQVYLKPFTKLCAEALGLDYKELVSMIDGVAPPKEIKPNEIALPEKSPRKKLNYKIPLMLIGALILLALAIILVNSRRRAATKIDNKTIVPASELSIKREIFWQKDWERPPDNRLYVNRNRLRIENTEKVWVCVVTEGDTLYKNNLSSGQGLTLTSRSDFIISLNRNDCLTAYFNGRKIIGIGSESKPLSNFRIGENPENAGEGNGN